MNSPLDCVLRRADVRDHAITFAETRAWPPADRDAIFRLGLLRTIEDADVVACNACGDPHLAEVVAAAGGEPRIYCPAVGLLPIGGEELRRWEIDFTCLAGLLAGALGLGVAPQVVVPGRIWLLGKRRVGERLAELFLTNGSVWPDGRQVLQAAARLQASPAPIIFCPNRLPADAEWRQAGRALFSLTEHVRLDDSRLVISTGGFEDLHRQFAESVGQPPEPTPVEQRPQVLKGYCAAHGCPLKDVCFWAHVAREDLNKWKLGRPQIPDHSEKAIRIERLLQRNQKSRV